MAQYVAAYKGYIADVPRVWFKRCDNHMFYFDEITQASATPSVQNTEINAGWSLFPVAVLPGQQSFEIQLTSGQFNSEMFALATNRNFNSETYNVWFTETVTFVAGAGASTTSGSATLSYAPVANTFWFNGLDDNDIVSINDRNVSVSIVPGDSTHSETGNNVALVGEVEVTYQHAVSADVMYSTNRESAIGEVWMRWPIYSANEDCTDSAIKGYVELHVFRCRVTQGPGFDSSYKSAQTNQVTFSAIDAKRADDVAYSIAYFELEAPANQQNG